MEEYKNTVWVRVRVVDVREGDEAKRAERGLG
jgi:hypothetical protein